LEKSKTGLQLWKTWKLIIWTSVGLCKVLEHKNLSERESKLL